MNTKLGSAIRGSIPGLLIGMFLSILFLSWPMRVLQLVVVLCIACFIIILRDDKPLQRGHVIAAWFVLGYGLASAILAVLDLIFPTLT